jgi:hypothetical protein
VTGPFFLAGGRNFLRVKEFIIGVIIIGLIFGLNVCHFIEINIVDIDRAILSTATSQRNRL